jgi:hypothetical protein
MKPAFLLFICFQSLGQQSDSTTFKSFFNFTFGNKYISKNAASTSTQIDYFEYLSKNGYGQLGIQFRKTLPTSNAITCTVSTYSDLLPRNIEIVYSKLNGKNFGYFAGLKTYGYYFSNYPIANLIGEFPNFETTNLNLNNKDLNQPSVYIGPLFYINKKHLCVESKLNIGYGFLGAFNQSEFLNNKSTFEKDFIKIKGSLSTYFFLIPDFQISYFPVVFKKNKIGLTAYGNYQYINRRFNYTKTTYRWTNNNVTTQKVNGPIRQFKNIEVNFGLIWQRI